MSDLESELEELIEQYDYHATMNDPHHPDPGAFNVRCDTYGRVADDLRELLNDE